MDLTTYATFKFERRGRLLRAAFNSPGTSAGGDLDRIQSMIDDPSIFLDDMPEVKRIVFALLDCPKPIIAKLNGHAIGLGATIALFCDVVFASRDAKIGDPHVRVGFVAGDGGAVIWPHLIGHAPAKEYLMTGRPLMAEEAERFGLINRAVPPPQTSTASSMNLPTSS